MRRGAWRRPLGCGPATGWPSPAPSPPLGGAAARCVARGAASGGASAAGWVAAGATQTAALPVRRGEGLQLPPSGGVGARAGGSIPPVESVLVETEALSPRPLRPARHLPAASPNDAPHCSNPVRRLFRPSQPYRGRALRVAPPPPPPPCAPPFRGGGFPAPHSPRPLLPLGWESRAGGLRGREPPPHGKGGGRG